jgi:hypothetical protein
MKKNLFISTGYFATFSSSIILDLHKSQKRRYKKNYLLIVISKEFSSDDEFKIEATKQISFAKVVGDWHKIEVVAEQNFPLSVYDNKNYDSELVKSLFNGDLSKMSFFEIYISSLNILPKLSKIISFSKANIFDEGIGTHFQLQNADSLSSFSNFYKIIPLQIKKLNSINLPKNLLYKKLKKLNKIYKTPKITALTSVFAISSFYFIISEKTKLIAFYKNYISDLVASGENIKIKLHPRNNIEDFLDFETNLLYENIPLLDMYLIKNRKYIKSLLSMSSSILFMAKYIYKIQSVFIEKDIEDDYTKNINKIYTKYINN